MQGPQAPSRFVGDSQPIDALALQELNGKFTASVLSTTPATLVTDRQCSNPALNYGAGHVRTFWTQADQSDSSGSGSGPSGLIYNTKTVHGRLVQRAFEVGERPHVQRGESASRCDFCFSRSVTEATPISIFTPTTLQSRFRRSATATQSRRTIEADEVRQDADSLPANAHIIFTGDWNLAGSTNGTTTSGSAEGAYKDLTAAPGATLGSSATAGSEQANDPVATTFQADSSSASNIKLYTESATNLTARFDLQLDSPSVVPANNVPGLQLVPNTYMSFGNSYYVGSTLSTTETLHGDVSDSTNTGPLTDLPNRSAVLTALDDLTDHLPVVADYQLVGVSPIPEPGTLTLLICGGILTLHRRRR